MEGGVSIIEPCLAIMLSFHGCMHAVRLTLHARMAWHACEHACMHEFIIPCMHAFIVSCSAVRGHAFTIPCCAV